jgi:hypothetical protein
MDTAVSVPLVGTSSGPSKEQELNAIAARRTAFVARFIVLREGKRSRAHRKIEQLAWQRHTTAEELADIIRAVFRENGDNMRPVERDVKRALSHSARSLNYFISEYATRATLNFVDSLWDYERSNALLFGQGDRPKPGGWHLPQELGKQR